MHCDDIHVALAEDVALALGLFGDVERKKCVGLVVDHRFGAVDVLGLGIIQHTAAERNDRAAHINDRHHDAVAEDRIQVAALTAAYQAGMLELIVLKAAALEVVDKAEALIRRIAQPKPADGRIGQAALFLPVFPGQRSLRRLSVQILIKIAGGTAVDLQKALARAGFTVILLGQGHSGAGRQLLDALDIPKVIVFAHKVDDIPRCAAAKAVKALGVRIDNEGRRFFIVEGAQPAQGAPASAQLHILADDFFNIVAANDLLYVFLRDHGLTAPPCQIVGAAVTKHATFAV